jgi:hypothetical protein|tara:strand:- start:121 stop:288 length:168 start_codon:yes stop_codon:yes gene_type:complete
MKITPQTAGVGTTGLTGITLLVLHTTGFITGWAWPILYVMLIISGIGQENRKDKK